MNEQIFNALILNNKDNVVIALKNIKANEKVSIQGYSSNIKANEDIPFGHKICISLISKEDPVVKYGECLGVATKNIDIGCHVHTYNVRGLNEKERLSILVQN